MENFWVVYRVEGVVVVRLINFFLGWGWEWKMGRFLRKEGCY